MLSDSDSDSDNDDHVVWKRRRRSKPVTSSSVDAGDNLTLQDAREGVSEGELCSDKDSRTPKQAPPAVTRSMSTSCTSKSNSSMWKWEEGNRGCNKAYPAAHSRPPLLFQAVWREGWDHGGGAGRGSVQSYPTAMHPKKDPVARLRQQLHIHDDTDIAHIKSVVSRRLREHKVSLVQHVIEIVGVERTLRLLGETEDVERQGGLRTANGTRRRTKGGVFFLLLKSRDYIAKEEWKKVFKLEEKAVKEQRKRKQSERLDESAAKRKKLAQDTLAIASSRAEAICQQEQQTSKVAVGPTNTNNGEMECSSLSEQGGENIDKGDGSSVDVDNGCEDSDLIDVQVACDSSKTRSSDAEDGEVSD